MVSKSQQHPTEICDFFGARLAVAAETEDGRRFAESFVKQMTGGEDRLKGRRMKQDFWDFDVTHKLWISGNHKPRIRGTDDAIWDRVRLVPFTVRFENPDKTLATKLEDELSGILNWALLGCQEWQADGLGDADAVSAATREYRSEQDVLAAFLSECCVVENSAECRQKDLYGAYRNWCEDSGEYAVNNTRFGTALREKGFDKRTSNGTLYRGIRLRCDADF